MQMDNSQHFTANKQTTHKKCINRFHKFPSFSTSIHLQNWKYFAVKQAFCQYIIVWQGAAVEVEGPRKGLIRWCMVCTIFSHP